MYLWWKMIILFENASSKNFHYKLFEIFVDDEEIDTQHREFSFNDKEIKLFYAISTNLV